MWGVCGTSRSRGVKERCLSNWVAHKTTHTVTFWDYFVKGGALVHTRQANWWPDMIGTLCEVVSGAFSRMERRDPPKSTFSFQQNTDPFPPKDSKVECRECKLRLRFQNRGLSKRSSVFYRAKICSKRFRQRHCMLLQQWGWLKSKRADWGFMKPNVLRLLSSTNSVCCVTKKWCFSLGEDQDCLVSH